MKCDLKQVTHRPDEMGEEQEIFLQCQRDRVGIYPTKWGRLGLCKPCFLYLQQKDAPVTVRRGVLVTSTLPKAE